eukprot:4406185-Prymnesium_polylepis.1
MYSTALQLYFGVGLEATNTYTAVCSVPRSPFPANVKPWPLEGLGATHGYALCEEGSCEAAE